MNDETLLAAGFKPEEMPLAKLFFDNFTLNEKNEWVKINDG